MTRTVTVIVTATVTDFLPVRVDGMGRTADGLKKMGISMKPEMGVFRLSLIL